MPAPSNSTLDHREPLGLAAACVRRGDFEAALGHLKTLLESDPRHEIATGMLAGVYAQLKMPERAEYFYLQVLRLNPANVLARFQLGLLQLQSGRPQDALETWQPTLADSQDYLTQFHSALALLELKRAAEARKLLEQAAHHMPRSHPLYPQLVSLRDQLSS